MIQGMFDWGAMPALERLVQYTEVRHKLLAHNVANVSTPNFRPTDVQPQEFQKALAEAIDHRRQGTGGPNGSLEVSDTRRLRFTADNVEFRPEAMHDNLLFHDRNDRSLEHLMQSLAENTMAHNGALEILRNEFQIMQTAIQERL